MPKPITIKPHFTVEELYQRYRHCSHPQEKLRWRALYLIAKGEVANRAAKRVGRSSGWITNLARRYNLNGPQAVANQKGDVACGPKPTLDSDLAKELDSALQGPAPDSGLWTSPKVARWIEDKTGKRVHPSTAWRAMQKIGFSLQVPRPHHRDAASPLEQDGFKKAFRNGQPYPKAVSR